MTVVKSEIVKVYLGPTGRRHDTLAAAEAEFTEYAPMMREANARTARRIKVRRLVRQGLSDEAIAKALNTVKSNVVNDRNALGLPSGWYFTEEAKRIDAARVRGIRYLSLLLRLEPEAGITFRNLSELMQTHDTYFRYSFPWTDDDIVRIPGEPMRLRADKALAAAKVITRAALKDKMSSWHVRAKPRVISGTEARTSAQFERPTTTYMTYNDLH